MYKDYRITYHCGISQIKTLIPHSLYLEDIKPNTLRGETLISEGKGLKNQKMIEHGKAILSELKSRTPDNWFTTESPLGKAMSTGILTLPNSQGGCTPIKVSEI